MRKILAFLIAVALVFPLILSAQALFSVESFVLDRDFYIEALDSDQVYESLLSDAMISDVLGKYLPIPPDADLTQIDAILKSVITREFFKEQIRILVNGLFDYLQGKTESFSPVINLAPVKTSLVDNNLDQLLAAFAAIMPICEPGQVPGIDSENQNACKPAGLNDDILVQEFLKLVFPMILAMVPNELPIGEKWDDIQVTRNWGPFVSGMALPASLMLIAIFLAFLAAGFWYIAAFIADESWRVRLLWLGWMLIIPSGLTLFTGLAVTADIPGYWVNLGIERASLNGIPVSPGIREVLRTVVSSSLTRVASTLMMVGGICSAAGLGFIFWGLAAKK